MANMIRAIISCDLARYENINVSNLGNSKWYLYLKLGPSNASGAGARKNSAIGYGAGCCVVLSCSIW
jgi:hypothetical protein